VWGRHPGLPAGRAVYWCRCWPRPRSPCRSYSAPTSCYRTSLKTALSPPTRTSGPCTISSHQTAGALARRRLGRIGVAAQARDAPRQPPPEPRKPSRGRHRAVLPAARTRQVWFTSAGPGRRRDEGGGGRRRTRGHRRRRAMSSVAGCEVQPRSERDACPDARAAWENSETGVRWRRRG